MSKKNNPMALRISKGNQNQESHIQNYGTGTKRTQNFKHSNDESEYMINENEHIVPAKKDKRY
jgi:hypothetical protein